MRGASNSYFLKEYGSWSVLLTSFLIGVLVSRTFVWALAPLLLALSLLVNSKQAFTAWLRKRDSQKALLLFLVQVLAASLLLIAVFRGDILMLLPLLVVPAAYLLSNRFLGEHSLVTEWIGFCLLSLAAVLAKFELTGGVDVRLFVGVAFYFTAGVFKIKALLLKTVRHRTLTFVSVLVSAAAYRGMHVPLIILAPLLDNIAVAITPYRVKLRTTGWIELAKSLAFLSLFFVYY